MKIIVEFNRYSWCPRPRLMLSGRRKNVNLSSEGKKLQGNEMNNVENNSKKNNDNKKNCADNNKLNRSA